MSERLCLTAFMLLLAAASLPAAPPASNLRAHYRDGQVFVQWDEPAGLTDVYFTVLMSRAPITADNARQATVAGHHIMPGESTDWWLNPETYGRPLSEYPPDQRPEVVRAGWLLEEGGERIAPDQGLFVHTVTPETEGDWYYAVVVMPPQGPPEVVAGVNSLAAPVSQRVAPIRPIWQGDPAAKPAPGSGSGLPLEVPLHAKRGRGGMDWLVFGDASLGWRDGLPFKFGSTVTPDAVRVSTTDRHWIARLLTDDMDICNRITPAIHTFWWGYNDHIYDPALMPQGVVRGYAEYRVLWLVRWAQQYFGTDPNRTYAAGGSMGGCACFNIAFRHPEVFAAIAPVVGIVEYRRGEGGDSVRRILAFMGDLDTPTDQGMTVGERLNAGLYARTTTSDLPYVVAIHGRHDGSIPWWVNPDFYRALQAGRHGCTIAWNAGEHGTTQSMAPPDINQRLGWQWLHRFALNQSYPAFSNCSLDNNPGNGAQDDGDIEGYMNRGLDWDQPTDTDETWQVVVRYTLDPAALPLTVDVTPRRRQAFRPAPAAQVRATATDAGTGQQLATCTLTVDQNGLLTYPALPINSAAGTRLTFTRAN